jgi:DNA repair protein RadC
MTKKVQGIHAGHRQRLRQQLLLADYTKMPEHLVMELMLTFILPYKDVNPLSHALLNEFGSLANVIDADIESLKKVKGIGNVTAHYLNFCSKIPEIYKLCKTNRKNSIRNVQQIVSYITKVVNLSAPENYEFMCLNGRGEVLYFGNVLCGEQKGLFPKNRELVSQILKYPTHSVVLTRTIPKGELKPSKKDIKYVQELKTILDSLSIRLIDYVIISPEGYFSFFKTRLLEIGGASEIESAFRDLEMSLRDGGIDYSFDEVKN